MIKNKILKKIIFGTAQFGGNYSYKKINVFNQKKINNLLSYLVKKKIDKIDTAEGYRSAHSKIGKYNKSANKKFKIFTKLSFNKLLSKSVYLENKIENIVKELNVSKLNILLHNPTIKQIKSSNFKIILKNIKKNKFVDLIGVSVDTPNEFFSCIKIKEIQFIQFPFNLIDGRWDIEKIKKLKKKKFLVARSIFLQGLLLDESKKRFPNKIKNKIIKLNQKIKSFKKNKKILSFLLSYINSNEWIDYFIIAVENLNQLKKCLDIKNYHNIKLHEKKLILNKLAIRDNKILRPYNWKM